MRGILSRKRMAVSAAVTSLAVALAMAGSGAAHAKNLAQVEAKEQVWKYTFKVDRVPSTFSSQTVTVKLMTNYWRWNSPSGIKVAPFGYAACYSMSESPKGPFDGVKVNPDYHDSNESVNPAGLKIAKSGEQGCDYHDILPSARKWLEMSQNPWVQAHGSVVYSNMASDFPFTMRTADYGQGTVYNLIQPGSDETYAEQVVDTDSITAQ